MAGKKFPFYMYHKDFDEPLRVDNKDEVRQLTEKGYVERYLYKEYPKWVKGAIVRTKEEEEKRLERFPDVIKGDEPVKKGKK